MLTRDCSTECKSVLPQFSHYMRLRRATHSSCCSSALGQPAWQSQLADCSAVDQMAPKKHAVKPAARSAVPHAASASANAVPVPEPAAPRARKRKSADAEPVQDQVLPRRRLPRDKAWDDYKQVPLPLLVPVNRALGSAARVAAPDRYGAGSASDANAPAATADVAAPVGDASDACAGGDCHATLQVFSVDDATADCATVALTVADVEAASPVDDTAAPSAVHADSVGVACAAHDTAPSASDDARHVVCELRADASNESLHIPTAGDQDQDHGHAVVAVVAAAAAAHELFACEHDAGFGTLLDTIPAEQEAFNSASGSDHDRVQAAGSNDEKRLLHDATPPAATDDAWQTELPTPSNVAAVMVNAPLGDAPPPTAQTVPRWMLVPPPMSKLIVSPASAKANNVAGMRRVLSRLSPALRLRAQTLLQHFTARARADQLDGIAVGTACSGTDCAALQLQALAEDMEAGAVSCLSCDGDELP